MMILCLWGGELLIHYTNMNSLELRAQELLKRHSQKYVIEKMIAERTGRTTITQIKRIVESLNKII